MNQSDVASRTEAWVRVQFSVSPTDPRFGPDTDLFDKGYVDSVGLAELIAFLEDEFGVDIPDELLLSDQFTTIDGISDAVSQLAVSAAIAQRNGSV